MDKKNKNDKILFMIALIVILIALVNLGITFYKFGGMDKLTGRATTDIGTANLSIQAVATINFTTEVIDWDDGSVADGAAYATLDSSNGTVTNWNGSSNNAGLVLQNDGNVNVRINLAASNDASGFIGGTTPVYQMQSIATGEAGACVGGLVETYYNANTTSTIFCDNLTYQNSADSMRINVRVAIPSDAPYGVKGSTITATALAIA